MNTDSRRTNEAVPERIQLFGDEMRTMCEVILNIHQSMEGRQTCHHNIIKRVNTCYDPPTIRFRKRSSISVQNPLHYLDLAVKRKDNLSVDESVSSSVRKSLITSHVFHTSLSKSCSKL